MPNKGDRQSLEQFILQETHWVIDDHRLWIPIPELCSCINERYPTHLQWLQETVQPPELTRVTREMAGARCHPVYQQDPSYTWIDIERLLQLFATADRGDEAPDTISSPAILLPCRSSDEVTKNTRLACGVDLDVDRGSGSGKR